MRILSLIPAVLLLASFFLACNQTPEPSPSRLPEKGTDPIYDSLGITLDSLRKRAVMYTEADSLVSALQAIDAVIEVEGLTVTNGIALSEIYLRLGKADQAQRTLYDVLESHPENVELFTAMARMFLVRENYIMCHSYAERAYALDPTLTKPVFLDGLAYAEEGDTTKAIHCFSNVLVTDPGHYDAKVQLGLLYSRQKNPLAVEYFNAALKEQPESMEVQHLLGLFYQQNGQFRAALNTYARLIEIAPWYFHAWYNTGYIHMVYLQQFDSAAFYFNEVVNLVPEYTDAIYNLGYAYELAGDFTEARKMYRRVLALHPDYVLAIQGIQRVRP
ncbi:MAG: tetratricopeptide repeat protein [Bacteroidales bacterium]|nr:tetratricopeptide repeat protein [Bacteroidales bacterium]